MTEPSAKRRPRSGPVFWGSLVAFCLLFGLLTYRLSIGGDPSGVSAAPAEPAVRKVIVRRVVTTVVPRPGAPAVAPPAATAAPVEAVPASESVPVITASS